MIVLLLSGMDLRVGSMIGHSGVDMYAVHRNQKTYITYNKPTDNWNVIEVLPNGVSKTYKNIEGADTISPSGNVTHQDAHSNNRKIAGKISVLVTV